MTPPSPHAALAVERDRLLARGQEQRDELVAGVRALRAVPAALLGAGLAKPWLLALPVVALVLLRRRLAAPVLAVWRLANAARHLLRSPPAA